MYVTTDTKEEDKKTIRDYKTFTTKEQQKFDTKKLLHGPKRSYSLFFEVTAWRVLYEQNPENIPLVTINELVFPMICRCCNEEIKTLKEDDDKRLFISENCKYHHQYHFSCIRQEFLSKMAKNKNLLRELTLGLEDCKKVQAICPKCGLQLTLKDLKKLFKKELETIYQKIIEDEYGGSEFVLSKDCKAKPREDKKIHALNFLSKVTPFKRKDKPNSKIFEMALCQRCNQGKSHSYEKERLSLLFGGQFSNHYMNYCAQCGKLLLLSSDRIRLSCRHNVCQSCGSEWIKFFDKSSALFKRFARDNPLDILNWPISSCYHCGKYADVLSIQVHDDHYMSLAHVLRKFFLKSEELKKIKEKTKHEEKKIPEEKKNFEESHECIEQGCKLKKEDCFGHIFSDIIKNLKDGKCDQWLKKMEEVKVDLEKCPEINKWLQHRYAFLNGNTLVGYKGIFEETKNDITVNLDKTINFLKNLETLSNNFVVSEDVCTPLYQNITGINLQPIEEVPESTKSCFQDAKIYGEMYGYKINTSEIYFMSLRGMAITKENKENIKNIGKHLDDLLTVSGPFGRGIYLSKNPNTIHSMTQNNEGIYYMAVVYIAESDKHDEVEVNPIDYKRVAADVHMKSIYKDEDNVDKEFGYKGIMKGNMIKVFLESKHEMLVVFEPALVIPLYTVSYFIDFTKLNI